MASSKTTQLMVMAAFLAIFLLISSEEVSAAMAQSLPEFILGRKVLEAKYEPNGRSGYNSYKPDGRSGYNNYKPDGRSGYNGYKPTGRGGYN